MAGIAGWAPVFERWVANADPTNDQQLAVLDALHWAGEHSLTIALDWVSPGDHPRRRTVEVADADVLLVFVAWTKPPVIGLQLIDVEEMDWSII